MALAERQPLEALHAVRRADKLVPRLSAAPPADTTPLAHIALGAACEQGPCTVHSTMVYEGPKFRQQHAGLRHCLCLSNISWAGPSLKS